MSKAAEDSIAKLMREGEAFAREFETFVAERPRSEFRGQDVNDWLETLTRERLDEFVTLLKVALAPEIHPLGHAPVVSWVHVRASNLPETELGNIVLRQPWLRRPATMIGVVTSPVARGKRPKPEPR